MTKIISCEGRENKSAHFSYTKNNADCFAFALLLVLLQISGNIYSQDQAPTDTKLRNTDTTGKKLDFNETNFHHTRIGMAFMNDCAWYSQDAKGKQQLDSMNTELENQSKVRDVHVFFSGKIKSK